MGVHGLWKLVEPSGRVVPLESMTNKVLAVDVSIWLHQAMKGMHDSRGTPVAIAHLLVLFHRLCKLLFYKIKPVFVFDGGVPALKRQTMAVRRQQTSVARSEATKVRGKLLKNLLKHEAVRQVLSDEAATTALGLSSFTLPGPAVEEDLYKLPPIATEAANSNSSDEETSSSEEEDRHFKDIHSIDVKSADFLALPADIRHDILTELKDTRKQSSWKNLEKMPKASNDFSDFQMQRLLQRRAVQVSLDDAGKEMGGKALSLQELEDLLGAQGVFNEMDLPSRRIAQDNTTRFMLVQKSPEKKVEEKVAEVKPEEEEIKIENRLKEVKWSSESDVDVILETVKRNDGETIKISHEDSDIAEDVLEILTESEIKKEAEDVKFVEPKSEELSQQQIYDLIKSQSSSKIEIVEEKPSQKEEPSETTKDNDIVEILSVLQGDGHEKTETREETENLGDWIEPKDKELSQQQIYDLIRSQSKTEIIEEKSREKKEEIVAPKTVTFNDVTEIISVLEDEDESAFPKTSKTPDEPPNITIIDEARSSKNVAVDSMDPQKGDDLITIEYLERDIREIKTPEDKPEVLPENEPSSDSDGEFVAIDEAESIKIPVAVESKDSLEVVIDPSKTVQEEDIFADVFEVKAPLKVVDEVMSVEDSEVSSQEETEETVEAADKVAEKVADEEADKELQELKRQAAEGNLEELKRTIEEENHELMLEQGRNERLAQSVTDQMCSEAQELLKLFGVPYIVAPMEAEAQCAILDIIGLTEGTITDDSDIWLFGGRVVYKNFFNQKKHVLEYRSEDIQKYFKLTREEMIKLALLVGSDYTTGLNGIGPVTAMEILAAFPSSNQSLLTGLQKFRDWVSQGCAAGPHRTALKKKIQNARISPGFPSNAVVEAYLNPEVDDSKEPFSWAKPNVALLQNYTKLKFGWSLSKCNELLMPVMKKLLENTSQTTMEKFFRSVPNPSVMEGALSKRVEKAVKRLGKEISSSEEDEPKPAKRRKAAKKDGTTSKVAEPSTSKALIAPKAKASNLIEKLHAETNIPQKESTRKVLEERKKKAIELFKISSKSIGSKKKAKTKVIAKKEVNLSESSSDGD